MARRSSVVFQVWCECDPAGTDRFCPDLFSYHEAMKSGCPSGDDCPAGNAVQGRSLEIRLNLADVCRALERYPNR